MRPAGPRQVDPCSTGPPRSYRDLLEAVNPCIGTFGVTEYAQVLEFVIIGSSLPYSRKGRSAVEKDQPMYQIKVSDWPTIPAPSSGNKLICKANEQKR
jgi:hypothetical protein